MNPSEINEKLARSLTAETTELLPFLPYLLQDLWELGSSPKDIISLLQKHMSISNDTLVLDLACGKGAVSINIAKLLGIKVHGFDLLPDFVSYAHNKALELEVSELCRFTVADVNEVADNYHGYDCVIFGAAGNILGEPKEMLEKLIKTIKKGGFIIIDEGYLPDDKNDIDIKYQNYEFLTQSQWLSLFEQCGLKLVEELQNIDDYNFDADNKAIAARANQLITKHPEKRAIFEGYVQSQLNECDDLESSIVAVTWILQKI
ncbi:MAG: class I SAM-dependent methyltransferase [Defluviitaleaceae bacterium]|nr:class I SAM-dependent methyltransferase [Defluviitaleaceae bacterium]